LVAIGAGDAVVVSRTVWQSVIERIEMSPMAHARSLARGAALAAASDGARLLTVKEAAARLRKSPGFMYRHADELYARRVGSGRGCDLLFRQGDLEAWLEGSRGRRQ